MVEATLHALVVVTADHGEEFREHGSTRHSRTLRDAAVRVPLVIVGPGVRPRGVADPVSHIDLLPTLLSLVGVPAPPGLDGRSLVRTVLDGARPRGSHAGERGDAGQVIRAPRADQGRGVGGLELERC